MSKNVLFLVHGMGRHPAAQWADAWKTSILENLRQYSPYREFSLKQIEEGITFAPINYDTVFEEEYRSNWNNLADALADASLPSSMTRVPVLVNESETALM